MSYRTMEARHHHAGTAHADAAPRTKRYAALLGVTVRTAYRHRSPAETKGSPLDQTLRYMDAVDDPWRIAAATMTHATKLAIAHLTRAQVIERIHELHAVDAIGEGEDNAARARRGLSMLDRSAISERDAAHDIELAALYLRAHELGISERELFEGVR